MANLRYLLIGLLAVIVGIIGVLGVRGDASSGDDLAATSTPLTAQNIVLGEGYRRDGNFLYCDDEKLVIPGLDVTTAIPLRKGLLRDVHSVFVSTRERVCTGEYREVQGADASTFSLSDEGIATDAKYVYTWHTDHFDVLQGADPVTITTIGIACTTDERDTYFQQDKRHVYLDLESTTIDAASFVYLGSFVDGPGGHRASYAKDKNSVYYCGRVLEGADPDSFVWFSNLNGYAKDKNHVYDFGQVDASENPATFSP